MNAAHRKTLEEEFALANLLMRQRRDEEAFAHLERAHVLGQEYVRPHLRSHWLMLKIAARRRDPVAVFGQGLRIVLGGLGSAIGRVPTGNTGGTEISMFKRMPIAPDLLDVMQDRGSTRAGEPGRPGL